MPTTSRPTPRTKRTRPTMRCELMTSSCGLKAAINRLLSSSQLRIAGSPTVSRLFRGCFADLFLHFSHSFLGFALDLLSGVASYGSDRVVGFALGLFNFSRDDIFVAHNASPILQKFLRPYPYPTPPIFLGGGVGGDIQIAASDRP